MTDIEAKAREADHFEQKARELYEIGQPDSVMRTLSKEIQIAIIAKAFGEVAREAREQALDDALAACKFGTSAADCEIAILALKDTPND